MVEEEKESTIDHIVGRLFNFKFNSAYGWVQELTKEERKIVGKENIEMIKALSKQYGSPGNFGGTASGIIWRKIEKFMYHLYKKGYYSAELVGEMWADWNSTNIINGKLVRPKWNNQLKSYEYWQGGKIVKTVKLD
jgi:hypothetical protein